MLFYEVINDFDCIVLEGYRNEEAQNRYFEEGKSKLRYPHSKHNKQPSLAVDIAPYPVDWNDRERFYYFAGYVKATAAQMGIPLRWGGDWDSDTFVHDQTFFDLPHFELRI
jgi:peptidoglycan L-alanyl-D-glutamate endopeptidase CwlK